MGPASALTFLMAIVIRLLGRSGLILVGALARTMLLGSSAANLSMHLTSLVTFRITLSACLLRPSLLPIAAAIRRLDVLLRSRRAMT